MLSAHSTTWLQSVALQDYVNKNALLITDENAIFFEQNKTHKNAISGQFLISKILHLFSFHMIFIKIVFA